MEEKKQKTETNYLDTYFIFCYLALLKYKNIMAKNDDKKSAIFNKYKENLNLLVDNDIIDGAKDIYICPLTLDEHKTLNEEDPLSLEDAPQVSLGGNAKTLTNTSANNTCGFKIDNHLVERFKYLEKSSFSPNSEIPIDLNIGGKKVRGTLKVHEDGEHELKTSKKNNNPEYLKTFVDNTVGGDILDIQIPRKEIDVDKAQYALLKDAYILFFEKTGYAYIFDDCFEVIRKQILNPQRRVIPTKFYLSFPNDVINNGVYFVKDKGLESVFVVFDLKYGDYQQKFGVFFPLGKNTLFKINRNLINKFKKEKEFNVLLQPITDNLLTDVDEINKYATWIDNIKL